MVLRVLLLRRRPHMIGTIENIVSTHEILIARYANIS